MGIKMGAAYDGDGRKWYADSYTKGQGKEPLHCEFCPALIHHVQAFSYETDGKPTFKPAHFALNPHERHASGCKHAVVGEIKIIAKDSEGLIEAIQEGHYRLRLMMIKEAFGGPSPSSSSRGEKSTVEHKNKVYERSNEKKLSAYINSAKRVLELRAACDDDAEIAEHLELVFEGNTVIPWQQFYFEIERYREAFRAVQMSSIEYPFAIHGTVKTIKPFDGKYGPTNILNLEKPRYIQDAKDEKNGVGIEVSVWTKNANWLEGVKEDDEVIILAPWSAKAGTKSSPQVPRKFETFTTDRLSTTLLSPAQIIRVPKRKEGKS